MQGRRKNLQSWLNHMRNQDFRFHARKLDSDSVTTCERLNAIGANKRELMTETTFWIPDSTVDLILIWLIFADSCVKQPEKKKLRSFSGNNRSCRGAGSMCYSPLLSRWVFLHDTSDVRLLTLRYWCQLLYARKAKKNLQCWLNHMRNQNFRFHARKLDVVRVSGDIKMSFLHSAILQYWCCS